MLTLEILFLKQKTFRIPDRAPANLNWVLVLRSLNGEAGCFPFLLIYSSTLLLIYSGLWPELGLFSCHGVVDMSRRSFMRSLEDEDGYPLTPPIV